MGLIVVEQDVEFLLGLADTSISSTTARSRRDPPGETMIIRQIMDMYFGTTRRG